MPDDRGADAPLHLEGSRDLRTGQVYVPARALAADGSLHECEPVRLLGRGRLTTWTRFAGRHFGQVDIEGRVLVQSELSGDAHEIGAAYELDADPHGDAPSTVRFRRV